MPRSPQLELLALSACGASCDSLASNSLRDAPGNSVRVEVPSRPALLLRSGTRP